MVLAPEPRVAFAILKIAGAAMDDYMREMVDLKTLVTKTLEKKGVLARIRAELRANVFQAMEEQDHEAESNGSTSFSLLGTCNERAKQLHNSPSGKLLMALVCDYMEWCELEHTLKVYMPELNQPRAYDRSELEDILGLMGDPNPVSHDSRPLLLTIVEAYLNEKKETSGSGSIVESKSTRNGATGGSRQSGGSTSNLDSSEALETRGPTTNRKVSEKPMGGSHDCSFQSRSETDFVGVANDAAISPGSYDDNQKLYQKSSRAQSQLAELPQHRRSSGLPAFSGASRSASNNRGSNGTANDQQSGSRDRDTDGKRRDHCWKEEDESPGGSFSNRKKDNAWRDQDYDNPYTNPSPRTDKGDGKSQRSEHSTSQIRRTSSLEAPSKALGNLQLDDDSASEFGSGLNPGSRAPPTASAGNKKQASAYFYSDSEEENVLE